MSETELRELDAEVAEKVMGWVWMQRVGDNCAWLFPPGSVDEPTAKRGFFGDPVVTRCGIVGPFESYKDAHKQRNSSVPRYSTDIAAAWLVVERMGMGLDPDGFRDGSTFGNRVASGWWAWVLEWGQHTHRTLAPTPALAICKAALAAVREPALC